MNGKSDLQTAVGCLVVGAVSVALIAAGAVLEGFVLRILWGWHLTPTVGIAAPPIAVCVGLAALATTLQNPPPSCAEKKDESASARALAVLFLRPVALLFIGWVAHLFAR